MCSRGFAALRAWGYTWDEARKMFSREPFHDWASHGGDAFTYGASVLAHHFKPVKNEETEPMTIAGAHYAFTLEQLHEDTHPSGGRLRERV